MAAKLRKVRKDLDEVVTKIEQQLKQIDDKIQKVDLIVDKDLQDLMKTYGDSIDDSDTVIKQKLQKHRSHLKEVRMNSLNQAKQQLMQLKQEILAA